MGAILELTLLQRVSHCWNVCIVSNLNTVSMDCLINLQSCSHNCRAVCRFQQSIDNRCKKAECLCCVWGKYRKQPLLSRVIDITWWFCKDELTKSTAPSQCVSVGLMWGKYILLIAVRATTLTNGNTLLSCASVLFWLPARHYRFWLKSRSL